MSLNLKLGKKAARPEAVKFKLTDFVNLTELPKPPRSFGHEALFGRKAWGMLGNDGFGDCVWAGAAHETMMWNKEVGKDVLFTDKQVLSDYSAVTGFNPSDPNTDQGTDMKEAASYRRKTGIIDAKGVRHKVAAYLSITPGNIQEHYVALYLFGAVGIGIEFPGTAMDQFNKGKSWSVVRGARIEGGHYIPLVAKRTHIECVTWGQVQPMTTAFFTKYNDESIVYVSNEALVNRKSPEGFDYEKLMQCLGALK
jgi:hypothetical protein